MGQLPLALSLDKNALFETYVASGAGAAVAHLIASADGERNDILWLCGSAGTGKTHLLQAACRRAGDRGARSMYVSLDAGGGAHPDQLIGVETLDLLALDAVDAVAGRGDWESRLFHVLNHFYSRTGSLLLAARKAPTSTAFALPDLASRAAGAILYRLAALDEGGQVEALMCHARLRGLELDPASARFLLNRVQRGMPELCAWLDHLDRASLAAQRKLTIPFIREAIAGGVDE
jgi:DnaA family protein